LLAGTKVQILVCVDSVWSRDSAFKWMVLARKGIEGLLFFLQGADGSWIASVLVDNSYARRNSH